MSSKTARLILGIFIVFLSLYSLVFIHKMSDDMFGKRYYLLFDDAMISMRYAKNFADGHGFVWNPGGERVEGYSNFLWTIYMSIPHFTGTDLSKTALFVQLSGLLFMILAVILTYKSAYILSKDYFVAVLAAVMLGLYHSLVFWFLSGMETSVLILSAVGAYYFSIVMIKNNSFKPGVYIIMFVASFVRPDMVVFSTGIVIFFVIAVRKHMKLHIIYGTAAILLPIKRA